jgi:DNA-binding NtrC family response regulator
MFGEISGESPTEEQCPTILIIDDEPILVEVLARYFRLNGLTPLTAVGGHEGITVFTEHHRDIALVLLDVRMPDLDGPATLAALWEVDPEVRCCFMSGDLGDVTPEQIAAMGVLHMFRKPFALRDLVVKLWELLRQNA